MIEAHSKEAILKEKESILEEYQNLNEMEALLKDLQRLNEKRANFREKTLSNRNESPLKENQIILKEYQNLKEMEAILKDLQRLNEMQSLLEENKKILRISTYLAVITSILTIGISFYSVFPIIEQLLSTNYVGILNTTLLKSFYAILVFATAMFVYGFSKNLVKRWWHGANR